MHTDPVTHTTTATDSTGQTMRAVVQSRYGTDADAVLKIRDVPAPTAGDDEVLIRVAAAGVDMGTAARGGDI